MSPRGLVAAAAAAVLACALVAAGVIALGSDGEERPDADAPTSIAAASPPREQAGRPASQCVAARPFTPDRVTVDGVVDAEVVPVPRDSRGVTGVLQLDDKARFAWDPPPGVRPGSARGNVLLNAHTWPDGTAAANALLDELDVGMRIVLRGGGQVQCYDVRERTEVTADTRVPAYYDTDGPPRVAIVVCSGERTGPGEWTHRTLWFARAVGSR